MQRKFFNQISKRINKMTSNPKRNVSDLLQNDESEADQKRLRKAWINPKPRTYQPHRPSASSFWFDNNLHTRTRVSKCPWKTSFGVFGAELIRTFDVLVLENQSRNLVPSKDNEPCMGIVQMPGDPGLGISGHPWNEHQHRLPPPTANLSKNWDKLRASQMTFCALNFLPSVTVVETNGVDGLLQQTTGLEGYLHDNPGMLESFTTILSHSDANIEDPDTDPDYNPDLDMESISEENKNMEEEIEHTLVDSSWSPEWDKTKLAHVLSKSNDMGVSEVSENGLYHIAMVEDSGTTATIDKVLTKNEVESTEEAVIRKSMDRYLTAVELTYWNHISFLIPLMCKAMGVPLCRAAEAIVCFEFSTNFHLRNFTNNEREELVKIYHQFANKDNMNNSTFLDNCRNLRRVATMVAINNMLCYKSKQNQSKRVFKCRFQTWKELSEHIEENGFSVNRNECRKTIENIRVSLLGAYNVATATELLAFAVVPTNRTKKNKVSKVTTTAKERDEEPICQSDSKSGCTPGSTPKQSTAVAEGGPEQHTNHTSKSVPVSIPTPNATSRDTAFLHELTPENMDINTDVTNNDVMLVSDQTDKPNHPQGKATPKALFGYHPSVEQSILNNVSGPDTPAQVTQKMADTETKTSVTGTKNTASTGTQTSVTGTQTPIVYQIDCWEQLYHTTFMDILGKIKEKPFQSKEMVHQGMQQWEQMRTKMQTVTSPDSFAAGIFYHVILSLKKDHDERVSQENEKQKKGIFSVFSGSTPQPVDTAYSSLMKHLQNKLPAVAELFPVWERLFLEEKTDGVEPPLEQIIEEYHKYNIPQADK
jgi:hypothetical protein